MRPSKRLQETAGGCLLAMAGAVAVIYGWAAMLGSAFGDGNNGWATAVFLSGILAVAIGLALLAAGRRR